MSDEWSVEDSASCLRLMAAFPASLEILRDIVGPHMVAKADSRGDRAPLRLDFIRCDDSRIGNVRRTGPIAFARVTIPLDVEGLPWRIAGKTNTAWSSIALVVGDANGQYLPFHERMDFTVMNGDVSLMVDQSGGRTSAVGVMRLVDGYVKVEARLSGESKALRQVEAFLSARDSNTPPLLGPHSMNRRTSGEAILELEGATPLSDLGLPARTQDVVLDSDLRWRLRSWAPVAANGSVFDDFVLWRRLREPFNSIQVQTTSQSWLPAK